MKQELAKSYQPKDFEDRIYQMWNDSGSFTPHVDSEKEPYTIVIPAAEHHRTAAHGSCAG